MHSCISCLCFVVLYCLYAIHKCHVCCIMHDGLVPILELGLHCGFMFRVHPWFTPVVTHVSPYPFSALLSDPCPTVLLVSNGLGHRSPRAHEKFSRFICSGHAQELKVDYARTTNRSVIISRVWPSHWYHHSMHSSLPSFSF